MCKLGLGIYKNKQAIIDYIDRCRVLDVKPILNGVIVEYENDIVYAVGFDDTTFNNSISNHTFVFPDICEIYKPRANMERLFDILLQKYKVSRVDFNNIYKLVNTRNRQFNFFSGLTDFMLEEVIANKWEDLYVCHLSSDVRCLKLNGIEDGQLIGFRSYSHLEKLEFRKVVTLPRAVFMDCNNLKELYLDNLVSIENNIFYNTTNLQYLYAPKLRIGSFNFHECGNLMSANLDSFSNNEGIQLFKHCSKLKDVSMKSLSNLGYGVFTGCANLESLELPNVEFITHNSSLDGCRNLRVLKLIKLKELNTKVFRDLDNLALLYINKDTKIIGKINNRIKVIRTGGVRT